MRHRRNPVQAPAGAPERRPRPGGDARRLPAPRPGLHRVRPLRRGRARPAAAALHRRRGRRRRDGLRAHRRGPEAAGGLGGERGARRRRLPGHRGVRRRPAALCLCRGARRQGRLHRLEPGDRQGRGRRPRRGRALRGAGVRGQPRPRPRAPGHRERRQARGLPPFLGHRLRRRGHRPQRPDHQLLEDAPPLGAARLRVRHRQRLGADRRLPGGQALPGGAAAGGPAHLHRRPGRDLLLPGVDEGRDRLRQGPHRPPSR